MPPPKRATASTDRRLEILPFCDRVGISSLGTLGVQGVFARAMALRIVNILRTQATTGIGMYYFAAVSNENESS